MQLFCLSAEEHVKLLVLLLFLFITKEPRWRLLAQAMLHIAVSISACPTLQNGTWLLGLQECMLPFVPWFESIQNTGYISFEESGKGARQQAWLAIELLYVIHLSSNERLAIKILLWLLFKSGRYVCPMQVHAMWMALNQLLGWEHSWTSKVFRSKSGSVLCGSPFIPFSPHSTPVYAHTDFQQLPKSKHKMLTTSTSRQPLALQFSDLHWYHWENSHSHA